VHFQNIVVRNDFSGRTLFSQTYMLANQIPPPFFVIFM